MSLALEEVRYRSAGFEDERSVVSLLRECGYDSDERFWSWIHRECPHGETIVEVAVAQDRVVGHYGVLPRRLRLNGQSIQAGLAIHAAIHPQFRGLSILRGLLDRTLKRCREAGFPLIYGYPRREVWLMYWKLFGWAAMGELVTLELPLAGGRFSPGPGDPISFRRAAFDEAYDRFPHGSLFAGLNHVVRDRAYLRWRFENHPRVEYELADVRDRSGSLLAYLILKRYQKEGKRFGHVVEADVRRGSLPVYRRLLEAALGRFQQEGAGIASCWMLKNSPLFVPLQEMGFRAQGFTTYAGYCRAQPGLDARGLDLHEWHMTMGDSDGF